MEIILNLTNAMMWEDFDGYDNEDWKEWCTDKELISQVKQGINIFNEPCIIGIVELPDKITDFTIDTYSFEEYDPDDDPSWMTCVITEETGIYYVKRGKIHRAAPSKVFDYSDKTVNEDRYFRPYIWPPYEF